MSKKKDPIIKKIEGKLSYHHCDPYMARFHVEERDEIKGLGSIEFDRGILPEDFELEKYEVSGSYKIEIVVKPK